MKLTWNWLLDHLETDKNINQITETLTKLGLEVASVVNLAEDLKEFISVRVDEVYKHPNADKLNICKIFDGKNTFKVVCGAHNVKPGMKGVFANIGSFIPGLNLTLKKGKIRGEDSFGMLCSEKELTLSDNHDGIMELPEDSQIGLPIAEIIDLNDPVIEIELTPNRGDCLGVRGIARDLSAAGMGKLKDLKNIKVEGDFDSLINWKIDLSENEKKLCPKIFGRSFSNLDNIESPTWLKNRLLAVDQRPISSIVDITNYIMIDLGRPLHAYDIEKIKGDFLTIKMSKKGDQFYALNGNVYELDEGMLVISDKHGVDDLAGIMGGERTGVTESTTQMFLEAAIFDPVSIAKTGRKLNINSDARYRFERGLDYESPEFVMNYAVSMIQKICGGNVSKVVSIEQNHLTKKLKFDPNTTLKLTGVNIENQLSEKILKKLGFQINSTKPLWDITVPPWRSDIDGTADIVEEIIRVNGYSSIPSENLPKNNYVAKPAFKTKHRQNFIASRILASRGYNEVITFSFLNKSMAIKFNGGSRNLSLVNPISSELTDMRPSILPTLLQAAQKNLNKGCEDLSIFEVGPIFKGDSPDEQFNTITGIRTGNKNKRDWRSDSIDYNFYDVKLDILSVLNIVGAPKNSLKIYKDTPSYFHPGRSAVFKIGQAIIANFGELHPEIYDSYGFKKPIIGFEIFHENIPVPKRNKTTRPMLNIASLQTVTREFAFLIDENMDSEKIIQVVKLTDKNLIRDVIIYDIFKGKKIPDGKKSIAFKVVIQPIHQTLTDKDLENISSNIIANMNKKLFGILREE